VHGLLMWRHWHVFHSIVYEYKNENFGLEGLHSLVWTFVVCTRHVGNNDENALEYIAINGTWQICSRLALSSLVVFYSCFSTTICN